VEIRQFCAQGCGLYITPLQLQQVGGRSPLAAERAFDRIGSQPLVVVGSRSSRLT
jgi:hypothetical protein